MLGAIAAIVMVVGTISATVSVTEHDYDVENQVGEPVVEVQAIEEFGSNRQ
jgi:hypothetical protein